MRSLCAAPGNTTIRFGPPAASNSASPCWSGATSSRSPCRHSNGVRRPADEPQARVGVGHHRSRDQRVVQPGHVPDARERRLQHEPGGRGADRQRQGNRSAERLAEVDHALRVDPRPAHQRRPSREGVDVGALLTRPPAAAAVAAIAECEHVDARRREELDVRYAVADVAGVAMQEQQVRERRRPRRHPPAVEALPVLGPDLDVRERDCGGLRDRARRVIDQRVEQRADHSSP